MRRADAQEVVSRAFKTAMKFKVFGLALASLVLIPINEANANCIRQSLRNHDYCGPEGSRWARALPQRVEKRFKRACAAHDVCYYRGGERIVAKMERKFRKSMLSADRKERRLFKSEMRDLRKYCDKRFDRDLKRACNGAGTSGKACYAARKTYYLGVVAGGRPAFNRAVDSAFTCRTR